jgi:outer membrane protein OmpU
MQRRLLEATALVTAAVAGIWTVSEAQAQTKTEPISVSVGGYHGQFVSYVDQDNRGDRTNGRSGKFTAVDVTSDSEIHFNGRTTLGNGLTLGFRLELEGNTAADQIDESYMFVEGRFGRVELGSLNNVHYRMRVVAPEAFSRGFITNDGNVTTVLGNITGSPTSDSTLNDTAARFRDNDSEKVNYYTPRFEGLQLGVSYVPNSSQDNQSPEAISSAYSRGYAVAANFTRTFGALDVAAYAGYFQWQGPQLTATTHAPDPSIYSVGGQVGYGGFRFGGSYGKLRRGRTGAAGTNAASVAGTGAFRTEGRAWDIGGIYTFGPASVSLTYFNGENDDSPVAGPSTGRDKLTGLALEGKYVLGPGVSVEGALFTAKFHGNSSTGGTTGALTNEDNRGTGIVTGLLLTF